MNAILDTESGKSVANLGAGLFKVRVSRALRGKSSGYRTLLVFKKNEKAIFLYGFAKNGKENLDEDELRFFKKLSKTYLKSSDETMGKLIRAKELVILEKKNEG